MGKSAQRKRNEREIGQANQAFDKTRKQLTDFKFEDKYAGLEAQQAQAAQLGQAQGFQAHSSARNNIRSRSRVPSCSSTSCSSC